jgi:geranylgeranyl diphosphate synthase type I
MRVVDGKAGAFASCGCALGGLVGGLDDTEGLARFGRHLGLVWQLRNDVLGIRGEPDTGKKALSDVRAGKKTPVIVALSATGRDRDELARRLFPYLR